jgi:succinyl-CoA synthetase beta subunit
MNIHEYQAKALFRKQGIAVPEGVVAFDVPQVMEAAKSLTTKTGSETLVVKAQIHAGGRGKAGGVKVVKGTSAAVQAATELFGKVLVTHQTGPQGKQVERVLVEQGLDIERELYLALVLDRERRRVAIMASTEGGMDIEEVAAKQPQKIHRTTIDPAVGLMPYQIRGTGLCAWPGQVVVQGIQPDPVALGRVVYGRGLLPSRDQPLGRDQAGAGDSPGWQDQFG